MNNINKYSIPFGQSLVSLEILINLTNYLGCIKTPTLTNTQEGWVDFIFFRVLMNHDKLFVKKRQWCLFVLRKLLFLQLQQSQKTCSWDSVISQLFKFGQVTLTFLSLNFFDCKIGIKPLFSHNCKTRLWREYFINC